ncbi:MAG: hypothetical protein ACI9U2_000659 [Bradymonadia bacterium]
MDAVVLNDALRFLLDHLHIIVPSVLAFWFLTTFLSPGDRGPPLRTGPCPRCGGSGRSAKRSPLSGVEMPVPCPACRGIGQVRDFQTFTHDVFRECKRCDATGFQTVVSGPHFPDGTPGPGAHVRTVRCESCVDGWIEAKGQLASKRIVPFSRPPPSADFAVVPMASPDYGDQDYGDDDYGDDDYGDEGYGAREAPPAVAVASMFDDDAPPPKG